jgi:hypothetical protein
MGFKWNINGVRIERLMDGLDIRKVVIYLMRRSDFLMRIDGLVTSLINTQYWVYPLVVRNITHQKVLIYYQLIKNEG